MIHRIALRNFKCFKELDIELSPITLLTGANSSGKSALMNSILSAFQTNQFPFYFSPNGKYVNMGDFEEISFNHLTDNKIGFDIDVNEYSFQTDWVINGRNTMPELYDLKAATEGLTLQVGKTDDDYELDLDYDSEKYHLVKKSQSHVGFSTMSDMFFTLLTAPIVGNFKDLRLKSLDKDEIIKTLLKDDKHAFAVIVMENFYTIFNKVDINFVSSFRLKPERTYYQKVKADDKIGSSGEDYLNQISEWEDEKAPEFVELNATLRRLNLSHAIKINKLAKGFELRVQVQDGGVWSSLADVGFGISQILPVIVADLQLSSASTLLVEQPAIHLHPSVQASLADYFIEKINETDKQYVIETHSEYLLNRIRLAIVKGELEPSDLAVYYFENSTDGGTVTHKIEFATDGQIHNAPQGFFDTYMVDAMEIVLHI